jgi:uncharacterized membrane protein
LALLLRAAEDVHPPIYYVLLYFVAQLPGDFVIVARGLSAVLAVISLGMLYIALPKNLSMTARLAACAFGATSITWSWYSQEVRAYALCFVIVTALINIGLRFLRRRNYWRFAHRLNELVPTRPYCRQRFFNLDTSLCFCDLASTADCPKYIEDMVLD